MAPENDLRKQVTEDAVKIEKLEESDRDRWTAINRIRNRLPHWASLLIALLTGFAGIAISMMVKGE